MYTYLSRKKDFTRMKRIDEIAKESYLTELEPADI
jgi:hypothetical protein